jgi:serine/threonine protein kinase
MSSCSHINVLKCLGVDLYPSEVWILLELCEGRSLADIMRERRGSFSEEEISAILRQVLEGLCYLHKRGIVHRDIKASNLLYHRGVVKIADFGISTLAPNASDGKFCRFGSPYWMSPEILSQSLYSDKADLWALGITAI